jgi:hypothetical protein
MNDFSLKLASCKHKLGIRCSCEKPLAYTLSGIGAPIITPGWCVNCLRPITDEQVGALTKQQRQAMRHLHVLKDGESTHTLTKPLAEYR